MKRYLYIILGAWVLAACEPVAVEPEVTYHFGAIATETSESSATITADIPYMLVDGVRDEGAVFYLRYAESASGTSYGDETMVEEYRIEGDKAIFHIEDLQPATTYRASLWLSGEHGVQTSESFSFTTKEHIAVCEISCNAEVEAKGIVATIKLSDIAYLVDGAEQEIKSVKLEYAPDTTERAWVSVDATNAESVTIPADGAAYLEENSRYIYRVTITPAAAEYQSMTTDEKEFKTRYAEITAEISKPEVAIVDSRIEVVVESIDVRFDGVKLDDYRHLERYILYREAGAAEWNEVELSDGDMSLALDIALFAEGKSYEFAAAVKAGADEKMLLSEVATIEIPKEETPTPPTPPTPPVTGDSDTSAIAGEWHLTEWRGAEPSFDVYLSITEDGVVSLWQRIESRGWELFQSVANYENGIISGVYTDGVAWSTSYSVTLADDSMTWVDTADSGDISVYTRSALPEGIEAATETTRSLATERFL